MDGIRPPDWLVRNYIERNTLALLFGDPEAGKSFCAIDIGLSVACGVDWHGVRVKPGPVIYIAGEGRQGLGRRFKAWSINAGLELDGRPFAVSSTATALTDGSALEELDDAIDGFAEDHGPPALIVVDTLNRNFGPGDENSANDMGALIAACDAVRERTGATVLLVHHSGHGDKNRSRGSGALRGGVDAEYRMSRDGDLITFEATKMKDGTRPAPITFCLRSVDLGLYDEGDAITSAVLDRTTPVPAPRRATLGKVEAEALSILQRACDASFEGWITKGQWRELIRAAGHHRQVASSRVKKLESDGWVVTDGEQVRPRDVTSNVTSLVTERHHLSPEECHQMSPPPYRGGDIGDVPATGDNAAAYRAAKDGE